MKLKLTVIAALLCLIALPASAESPYIFGWHFWRDSANIDSGLRSGWVTEYQAGSTNFQPDVDKFKRIADEGHTIIMRLDWGDGQTFPDDSSNDWIFAARYAYLVDQLKDYCHIWLIGNEEFMDYDCFRTVRKAVHAVQPEAIFCPGSPHSSSETMVTLGNYADGLASHGSSTTWLSSLDAAMPEGKTKLCYITEFAGAPPNLDNQLRTDYNNFNYYNATHTHKLECATRFVYFEYGSEYTALQMEPMQNADFREAALGNFTNSYANPYVQITNITVTGLTDTTAQVTWNTDLPSTAQVEYWEKKGTEQFWSSFYDLNAYSHSAVITGLQAGHTYEFLVKAYSDSHPLTLSKVQTYVHEPPTSGTIAGQVTLMDGTPVHDAKVARSPGGVSFITDQDGNYTIRGCPAGTYSVTVTSSLTRSLTVASVQVAEGNTTQLDVELVPKVNYLQNPGFESNMTGWTSFDSAPGIQSGTWYASIQPHGGSKFLGYAVNWGMPDGGVYQRVAGLPAGTYQFSAYVHLYFLEHPYSETKHRVGLDPYGGTNPASGNIRWSDWEYNFWIGESEWHQLESPAYTVNSGVATVFIEYEDTCMNGWHIHAYDDTALTGPAVQAMTVPNAAEAKAFADGALLEITGMTATTDKDAVGTDVIYIEDSERMAGIKVNMTSIGTAVSEGNTVTVTGTMATDGNQERYIQANSVTAGAGTPLDPLGVVNKSTGGDDFQYDAGPPVKGQRGVSGSYGTNNIGLLVRTTGEVTAAGTGYVMISDGSPVPIKVDASHITNAPSVGQEVAVTGISSVEVSGSDLVSVLRARKNADMQVLP